MLVVLTSLACHAVAATAQERPSEQTLHAAMVFNFLKFTEFPPESAAPSPLRLCFSVGDPVQGEALAALAGRKVWNRELVVVRLGERSGSCHVLYVDSRQRWNAAVESHSASGALTISSYHDFVADGGMIEIDLQRDGTRFDVNLAQTRVAHFRLSPQLLRLARRVHE
jgi:hypothetical protein